MTSHVKIQGVIPRIQYIANGTLTTFTFPFAIFSADNVEVYLNDVKQVSTAYTISGVRSSNGGSITFVSAPANGTTVTIVRNLAIERTSDFQEGGALRADTLNDEFDYQIACQQQIADNVNRTLVLPPYAVAGDVKLTLPLPSAGKSIVWNADGTNLENSTVEVNALESTLKGYKETAQNAASTATTKADIATDAASTATTQAGIATEKAAEATTTLANKANTALNNIAPGLDLVTESYGPDSDGFWYRVYKSGWIEQGGQTYHASSHINQATYITFLKPFTNTNYIALSTSTRQWESFPLTDVRNKTNTTMEVWGMYTYGENWYACGN